MDRLLSNYGENILGSLYWALNAKASLVKRGVAWHLMLALGYIDIYLAHIHVYSFHFL
jgi:hypothetical protein